MQKIFTREEDKTSLKAWVVVILLTLLWHFLILQIQWQKLMPERAIPIPPPIEVQSITPKKLDSIRKQWQKESKKFLLNKDQSKPDTQSQAPEDARYVSDRNRQVEKEQRARQTQVLPQPNIPAAKEYKADKQKTISKLGVPLDLESDAPQSPKQPPQIGGDQALNEKELPYGSENLLNTQRSVYYSFYSRLYSAIAPIWSNRINDLSHYQRIPPGEYTTQVDIVLDRHGNLIRIEYLKNSGVIEFDNAVEQSWRKIRQFPNPPHDLLNELGEVHTGWTFTVDVGDQFGIQFQSPERNY